jgi:hypothetical protein
MRIDDPSGMNLTIAPIQAVLNHISSHLKDFSPKVLAIVSNPLVSFV